MPINTHLFGKKAILKNYAKLLDKLGMLRAEAENVLDTNLSGTTEDELLVLLEQAIHEKQVEFVHGSGKRKHP